MGGMPPGTTGPGGPGPSAHALSHLGPTHGHQMFPPQQMGQACKPLSLTIAVNSALQSPVHRCIPPPYHVDIGNISKEFLQLIFALDDFHIFSCD